MAFLVTLGTAVVVSTTATPSGAGTVLAPTQVFASVGASTVNVYTPGTPGVSAPNLVTSLNDGSVIPPTSPVYPGYPSADNTAGSAFDANGNFYVTDDYSGQISKYDPNGALDRRLRLRACRTRSPSSSTTRATSTWASRTRPTSPSSTRAARTPPTSDP